MRYVRRFRIVSFLRYHAPLWADDGGKDGVIVVEAGNTAIWSIVELAVGHPHRAGDEAAESFSEAATAHQRLCFSRSGCTVQICLLLKSLYQNRTPSQHMSVGFPVKR